MSFPKTAGARREHLPWHIHQTEETARSRTNRFPGHRAAAKLLLVVNLEITESKSPETSCLLQAGLHKHVQVQPGGSIERI